MEIVDYLFLGADPSALRILKNLKELKQQKVPSQEPFTFKFFHYHSLEDSFQECPTPNTIRGEQNITTLQQLYPSWNLHYAKNPSTFYKDKNFYPFTGRKSSMPLLDGEEFFTQPSAIGLDFEIVNWKEIIPELKDHFFVQEVKLITKLENNDWSILLKDGTKIQAKVLICSFSPSIFYQKFEAAAEISDLYHKSFKAYSNTSAITFQIKPTKVFKHEGGSGTILIPLDQTKSMGHIIGELNIEEQDLRFFAFLEPQEENPKVLMDKIKLIKRKLRHVFPSLKKEEFPQKLWIIPGVKSDPNFDEKYQSVVAQAGDLFKNLHFIGPCAPLTQWKNSSEIQYAARSCASVHETLSSLMNQQKVTQDVSELLPCSINQPSYTNL